MKLSKNFFYFVIFSLSVICFNGCAAAKSSWQYTPWGTEHGAGFFKGLLDGFIAVWCLIISAFTPKVHVYEVKNIGFCYDLGFTCGIYLFLCLLGGNGGDGGNGASRETPPPDPGKPEDRPGPSRKKYKVRLLGTRLKVPVNPAHWHN